MIILNSEIIIFEYGSTLFIITIEIIGGTKI